MTPLSMAVLVLLAFMLVGQVAFIYRYARFSPWRATWQGITLMAQTATLAALVGFFIFDTFIEGSWPGRAALLITFLTLLAVEAWLAFSGLLHVQRANHPVSKRQGTGYVHPDEIKGDKK